MASKIESKCRSGAEYSLSQSSLSITNQNKDYNSNKRIALFTLSSFRTFQRTGNTAFPHVNFFIISFFIGQRILGQIIA